MVKLPPGKAYMEKIFTDIINAHRGIIYKICNLYCRDEAYKKDLFQEIVLQLWKSYPSFRKEAKSSTWIYRVALNTAIANFRKEIRKPDTAPLTDASFWIPEIEYPLEKEHITALMQAIDQLNKLEKAIVLLYLEEKTYDEISEIIGMTNSNVGVRLNRIKAKLGKIIKIN